MPRVSTKSTSRSTASTKARTSATATKRKAKAKKPIEIMFRPIKEKMTKSQIIQTLADNAEISKAQATAAYNVFGDMILASICKGSARQFALPGFINIKTRNIKSKVIKAIKPGTEVRNPRTGEMVAHPGRKASVKPATIKVKITPLGKVRQAALM